MFDTRKGRLREGVQHRQKAAEIIYEMTMYPTPTVNAIKTGRSFRPSGRLERSLKKTVPAVLSPDGQRDHGISVWWTKFSIKHSPMGLDRFPPRETPLAKRLAS